MPCVQCGAELTGRQTRFCSRKCKERHATDSARPSTPRPLSGSANPNWKGGHRHWAPGRYGKDKDGLSWKVQRKLAWERDGYTCQHCHTKGRRNPDVHHKVPFRVSHSHALGNLICLCQKCHLKEEAKVQDQWGGQVTPRNTLRCACGSPTKLRVLPLCFECATAVFLEGRMEILAGLSLGQIGELRRRLVVRGYPIPPRPSTRPRASNTQVPPPQHPKAPAHVCPCCGYPTRHYVSRGCKHCLLPWVLEQRKTRSLRSIAAELGVTNPTIVHWCHFNPG